MQDGETASAAGKTIPQGLVDDKMPGEGPFPKMFSPEGLGIRQGPDK